MEQKKNPRVDVAVDIYGSNYEGWENAVIVLAGGPGFGSRKRDMIPLAHKAGEVELPFVLVDMPGGGDSWLPGQDKKPGEEGYVDYSSLWTIENSAKWLREILDALGVKEPNLVGHSYGAMTAIDYALIYPEDVMSLTAISPMEYLTKFQKDGIKQLLAIHPQALEIIADCEERGDTNNPVLHALRNVLDRRHVLGLPLLRMPQAIKDSEALRALHWREERRKYKTLSPEERKEYLSSKKDPLKIETFPAMHGELRESYGHFEEVGIQPYGQQVGLGWFDEIFPSGNMRWFNRLNRLHIIAEHNIPTLIEAGTEDDTTPGSARMIQRRIPGSKLVVVEGGHMHFWSNPRSGDAIAKHLIEVKAQAA